MPSALANRQLLFVGLFTLAYLLVASAIAFLYGNLEFLIYIAVVVVLGVLFLFMHRRVRFSPVIFWGLSLWGLLHMLGGLMPVPPDWPIEGSKHVVYSWWVVPDVIKMDNLIHAYGFGLTAWLCWQALQTGAKLERPSFGLLALCALASMGLGAANEIIEYAATEVAPSTNVGGYLNTSWDLIWNAIGSVIGATLAGLFYDRRPGHEPAAIL